MGTEFKGTPGRWFYQEESDAYTHIVRPVDKPGRIISHLAQDKSGEAEANARLIAAAPELLDALQILLWDFASIVAKAAEQPAVIIAKSAIAKALNPGQKIDPF